VASIHPFGVRLFERQWLVNLILWGNYARLCDAALTELGETLPGRTLQVACVYGDLTDRIGRRAAVQEERSMSWTCCGFSFEISRKSSQPGRRRG
jgi:hypothetical protein